MAAGALKFAILGGGAMGSIIGAHLARAGHEVVVLARGQRAEEIERRGLRIIGLTEFSQAVRVVADPAQFGGADVLIVATKSYGTQAALEPLRHAAVGTAFSIQNGLTKNEQLAAVWGRERILGALADTSGELLSSGEVLFTRNEQLLIGELPDSVRTRAGPTEVERNRIGRPEEAPIQSEQGRASNIARAIDEAGVRCRCVPDIESLEWSKFAAWVALMVPAVTTRLQTWKYLTDPDLAAVSARLVREVGALASARGIVLSDSAPLPVATLARAAEEAAVAVIQAGGHSLKSRAPEHRMSTLQDLEARRPLELEETLGFAVREAARSNLDVPLLRSFYSLIAGIDRIRRE